MNDQRRVDGASGRQRLAIAAAVAIAFLAGLAMMALLARHPPQWLTRAPAATARSPAPQPEPSPTMPVASDPATLATREATLAAQLATLEARTATIGSDADVAAGRAARAEAILIAFAARRAIDRGVGLGYLEEQVRRRFGTATPRETEAVIRAARSPVTLEDLRLSLDAAAPTLLAGRSDWWAGVGSELRNLVVIHKAGTPSPLPSDRLARARRMIDGGKVEAALAEVSRLPGAAQAQGWTAAARRYIDARRALDQMEAAAILGLATPPTAAGPDPLAPQRTPVPAPSAVLP